MGDLLDHIGCPADLKRLAPDQLPSLCAEMRSAIRAYVDERGGHLGSNLGVVELTVALHRVFDVPRDQIVLDVSHQCYAHKMLTGRAAAFADPSRYGEASGFFAPGESDCDPFQLGHSSTAIGLACGLARARDLRGEDRRVVAVVGDGALSGGAAFEGLDNAAALEGGLVIVVNDNERSIARNVGGLYDNLAALRESGGTARDNLFRALGLDYRYVEEGNDVLALVAALEAVRDVARPTVLHVHTTKGKGHAWAERHPEEAHEPRAREARESGVASEEEAIFSHVAERLVALAAEDPRVVVVCPATPLSHGITPAVRDRLGDRYVDVGIAEGHALTFAAGLARGGARPVVCVSSTFLQRAYDQLVEDVALNALPVVVLVYKAGLSDRDATHVGSLDVAFLGPIPNLTCLAPANAGECASLLGAAVRTAEGPVVIRVPRRDLPPADLAVESRRPLGRDATPADEPQERLATRWEVVRKGARVAFVTLGSVEGEVTDVAAPLLEREAGIVASVVRARCHSTLDEALLERLGRDHELVVVAEDGVAAGGLGQRVASFFCNRPTRVLARGGAREFTQRMPLDEQYRRYRLSGPLLAADVLAELGLDRR